MTIVHNGIKFTHDIDKSLIEIDTSINGVTTDYQFVILIASLQDYLKYKSIRYFVLNKKNNDFELSCEYRKYRQTILIEDLLRKGIEQIFYIVSADKTEKYRKELPAYVRVVSNYEEIDAVIENKQGKL
ncbi:MAG: hypothetical protein V1904_08030 [Bacteroidota bacterium]